MLVPLSIRKEYVYKYKQQCLRMWITNVNKIENFNDFLFRVHLYTFAQNN